MLQGSQTANIYLYIISLLSCGSTGKESACSAGDLGSIPVLEDPLEKGMATHSSILACRIPWTKELVDYSPWGHKESDMTE